MAELTVICKLLQLSSSSHLAAEIKIALAGNSVEKEIGLTILVTMNIAAITQNLMPFHIPCRCRQQLPLQYW